MANGRPQNFGEVLFGSLGQGLSQVGAQLPGFRQQQKENQLQQVMMQMRQQQEQRAQQESAQRIAMGRVQLQQANVAAKEANRRASMTPDERAMEDGKARGTGAEAALQANPTKLRGIGLGFDAAEQGLTLGGLDIRSKGLALGEQGRVLGQTPFERGTEQGIVADAAFQAQPSLVQGFNTRQDAASQAQLLADLRLDQEKVKRDEILRLSNLTPEEQAIEKARSTIAGVQETLMPFAEIPYNTKLGTLMQLGSSAIPTGGALDLGPLSLSGAPKAKAVDPIEQKYKESITALNDARRLKLESETQKGPTVTPAAARAQKKEFERLERNTILAEASNLYDKMVPEDVKDKLGVQVITSVADMEKVLSDNISKRSINPFGKAKFGLKDVPELEKLNFTLRALMNEHRNVGVAAGGAGLTPKETEEIRRLEAIANAQ